MINNYWISIWRIWRLHQEKENNTGSFSYKLHNRQGDYEIVKEMYQQMEILHKETGTKFTCAC